MGLHLSPSLGIRETNLLFSLGYSSPHLQVAPELGGGNGATPPPRQTSSADRQSAKMGELEAAGHRGLVQAPASQKPGGQRRGEPREGRQ